MKITHYLSDYSRSQKELFLEISKEMNYNYQLKLAKQLNKENLPDSLTQAKFYNRLLKPLSDNKKIKLLTQGPLPKVYSVSNDINGNFDSLIQKESRANRIKKFTDVLAVLHKINSAEFHSREVHYDGSWAALSSLHKKSFSFQQEEYHFFLPQTLNDFLTAALQLKTCVHGYATSHYKREVFKFFLKVGDKFICSVQLKYLKEFKQVKVVCYAVNNTRPNPALFKKIREELNPFWKDLNQTVKKPRRYADFYRLIAKVKQSNLRH